MPNIIGLEVYELPDGKFAVPFRGVFKTYESAKNALDFEKKYQDSNSQDEKIKAEIAGHFFSVDRDSNFDIDAINELFVQSLSEKRPVHQS